MKWQNASRDVGLRSASGLLETARLVMA